MALNIKDRRTDELARRVAELSDKGITEALRETLELRVVQLEKARLERSRRYLKDLHKRMAKLPVLDPRSTREIQDELNQDIFDSHGAGDFVRR